MTVFSLVFASFGFVYFLMLFFFCFGGRTKGLASHGSGACLYRFRFEDSVYIPRAHGVFSCLSPVRDSPHYGSQCSVLLRERYAHLCWQSHSDAIRSSAPPFVVHAGRGRVAGCCSASIVTLCTHYVAVWACVNWDFDNCGSTTDCVASSHLVTSLNTRRRRCLICVLYHPRLPLAR